MRIGLFGGTFNPPHLGHVVSARACVKELNLDKLYFIPANIPPHKRQEHLDASPERRLEMARLVALMVDKAEAWDIELNMGGVSYTAQTLEKIKEECPEDELWFIMGSDSLLKFDTWWEPGRIAALANIAVVCRENNREGLRECAEKLHEQYNANIVFIENQIIEVSSTEIRQGKHRIFIPGNVGQYILKNCLYVDFEAMRKKVYRRMSHHRFEHSLACEKMAVELAEKYGADINKARAAALLHDITKELPLEEQLILKSKWDIIVDYHEDSIPALIHADTGAVTAERDFGVGKDVSDAIRYHATGKADMSTLEKVIFVADKCEETRHFPDVDKIREVCDRDLDAAVLMVLQGTAKAEERLGLPMAANKKKALDFYGKLYR